MLTPFNIAQFLPQRAAEAPDRLAVVCEHAPDAFGRKSLTFAELDAECDALAHGLTDLGIEPGWRVLLGVKPGLDFVALTFALFKMGAIPVLIDPGMGRKNLLNCIQRVKPYAMIAIPAAHLLRSFTRHAAFKTLRLSIMAGRCWFWGGFTTLGLRENGLARGKFPTANTFTDSPAAILFTSGGTGTPKGVCYEHGMFGAQVEAIKKQFNIEPGEIDLPAFPLFALFSTALGTTCVIPDMNSSRPAQCNPDKIIDAIRAKNVTYSFGSPAIWKRVGPRCAERGLALPSLKRILMAGAPVRGEVLAPFAKILAPGSDVFIPYGATEALPVSVMRGSEVLRETWAMTRQGRGHCVGVPLPGVEVRIVEPEDRSLIAKPAGNIGEIIVCGPTVTKEYFEMPAETAQAKIIDPASGQLWHRMGDMGYIDAQGRIWFCGRKAHRVFAPGGKVFYSVCCEAQFEEFLSQHFGLHARAALGGIGAQSVREPVLILEAPKTQVPDSLAHAIVDEWRKDERSRGLEKVLFHRKPFPVDVRHNAKIDRDALSRWAATV